MGRDGGALQPAAIVYIPAEARVAGSFTSCGAIAVTAWSRLERSLRQGEDLTNQAQTSSNRLRKAISILAFRFEDADRVVFPLEREASSKMLICSKLVIPRHDLSPGRCRIRKV